MTSTCKAAICQKVNTVFCVCVMSVCGLAAGTGAHYLPDDACGRVPGMGRDRAETSKDDMWHIFSLNWFQSTHWMRWLRLYLCLVTDSPGNDAGDRLRSWRHCVTGGVDTRGHDHHPTAGTAGPGDRESTHDAHCRLSHVRRPRQAPNDDVIPYNS